MAVSRLASRLWRRVHPDLFARWPTAQAANETSMQNLRSILDAAEDHSSALRTGGVSRAPPPPAQEVQFFVVDDDSATVPLRIVRTDWRSPRLPHAERPDAWLKSAEHCVSSLLYQIDNETTSAPGDEEELVGHDGSRPLEGTEGAAPHSDAYIVQAARAAAARRRREQQEAAPPQGDPSRTRRQPRDEAESMGGGTGGGELQTELLFFYETPTAEREPASARLASLMRQVLPAGSSHGPLLVCGRLPPPAEAVERGFACVPLNADAADLRAALESVRSAVAARRAQGDELLRASRRLGRTLGCEQLRWSDALSAPEAAAMCRVLLPQAQGMRAALDAPWRGLFVDLEPAASSEGQEEGQEEDQEEARGQEASSAEGDDGGEASSRAHSRVVDAAGGGGSLQLLGEEGATMALRALRGPSGLWRPLRQLQERHLLCEELRERLGCRAVVAHGAPEHTAAQCNALRELVRTLRSQPVLLGGRREAAYGTSADGEPLAEVTLVVGAELPPDGDSHLEREGVLEPGVLRLPNHFEAAVAVQVLQARARAALARRPMARKRGRANGKGRGHRGTRAPRR